MNKFWAVNGGDTQQFTIYIITQVVLMQVWETSVHFAVIVWLDACFRRHSFDVIYWFYWLSFFVICILWKGFVHILLCVFLFSFSNKTFTYIKKNERNTIRFWVHRFSPVCSKATCFVRSHIFAFLITVLDNLVFPFSL